MIGYPRTAAAIIILWLKRITYIFWRKGFNKAFWWTKFVIYRSFSIEWIKLSVTKEDHQNLCLPLFQKAQSSSYSLMVDNRVWNSSVGSSLSFFVSWAYQCSIGNLFNFFRKSINSYCDNISCDKTEKVSKSMWCPARSKISPCYRFATLILSSIVGRGVSIIHLCYSIYLTSARFVQSMVMPDRMKLMAS